MNRCPRCEAACGPEGCSQCGFRPEVIDGFTAYAPELARNSPGFDPDHFRFLADLEAGNFWFQARNQLILWALRKCGVEPRDHLEVGCGTGFVLSAIASAYPDARVSGSEIFVEGLSIAARRVPRATFFQMDAQSVPFVAAFDSIGAYDVVEHIEKDELVLSQLKLALKPGGAILLTVPQHAWLWSTQDDWAHHVRRYAPGELEKKLADAGFEVQLSTSFVSLLMPAMMLSRLSRRKETPGESDPFAEFRIPAWLNSMMLFVMGVERTLIRMGLRFPVGGSRLVVARKP